MKTQSILPSVALIFTFVITGMSCNNPTGPHINSVSPSAWTLSPAIFMSTTLYGINLALPTTTGYTFGNDVQVYFRYKYPDLREWVQIPPPFITGWSNSKINIQLPSTTQIFPLSAFAVTEEGEIQFKVVVPAVGESNYFNFKVYGAPGSPHIYQTRPTVITYMPIGIKGVSLYGSHFACPNTTGYTFNTDIQVYIRYLYPELTAWTRLLLPNFTGWSSSVIGLEFATWPGSSSRRGYVLTSEGKVQFKVISRCYGTSNVYTVAVR